LTRAGHEPFDSDIARFGRYQYTSTERLSSVRANRRYSDMILSAADFRDRRVADIGCGDGTYTRLLLSEGQPRFILGIDPSQAAVETARQSARGDSRIAFQMGTASDLIAQNQTFDIAVYRGVIHHVEEPQREIADALKLASLAIFLEPNGTNPVVKVLERVSPYHREHNERSYSLTRFRHWVRESGGQIRRAACFGLVPQFAPEWIVRPGSALEPVIERIPAVRRVLCGQLLLVVARK
jgi:2-polyprenyl-3-methyl-5-hydroxy-6-metoxy-1,4-benzoquinol methylase